MSLSQTIAKEAPSGFTWPEFSSWFSKHPQKSGKITAPIVWKHYRTLGGGPVKKTNKTATPMKKKKVVINDNSSSNKEDVASEKEKSTTSDDESKQDIADEEKSEEDTETKTKAEKVKSKKTNKLVTPMKKKTKKNGKKSFTITREEGKQITNDEFSQIMTELNIKFANSLCISLEKASMIDNKISVTLKSDNKDTTKSVMNSLTEVKCFNYDQRGNKVKYSLPLIVE